MPTLRERFEAKVNRSADHHVWLGTRHADGVEQIRVNGKLTTARRVAWELKHGPLRLGARVAGCAADPGCVRVSHLALVEGREPPAQRRGSRGGGSKAMVRPGVWKLTVTVGRFADGSQRRVHTTVHAASEVEATRALARFVAEVRDSSLPHSKVERDITVDEAVERFLTEHLQAERGREQSTIEDYRGVHAKWLSPEIGGRRLRDVDEATIDLLFGRMRQAGMSTSRMNSARNLYGPLFRWAKRRGIVRRNPMAEFQLPTSLHVTREHAPPEVDQLIRQLSSAMEAVPDVGRSG